MTKIIAITNQKGGVGKTTTCINLAASLAVKKKYRILLIDLDPQGNATMGSGVDKSTLTQSMNDVLMEKCSLSEVIKSTAAHYDVAPANQDLTEAEVALLAQADPDKKLHRAILACEKEYDFIFIDSPPSLNTLTLNTLVAADSVLIPMQCEYFALEGLASLINTIDQIREAANERLQIEGLLCTMFDKRNRLALEVAEQLRSFFSDRVYKVAIPRNVRLAEAPSHGLPVVMYDKKSPGAQAYLDLAVEFLEQQKQEGKDYGNKKTGIKSRIKRVVGIAE